MSDVLGLGLAYIVHTSPEVFGFVLGILFTFGGAALVKQWSGGALR